MEEISWQQFEVEDLPEARKPAYKVKADFGPEIGIRKTSARVTDLYSREELLGRQIIGVVNFPVKQIGPTRSEFLLTGFYRDDTAVVLAIPERDCPTAPSSADTHSCGKRIQSQQNLLTRRRHSQRLSALWLSLRLGGFA